MSEIDEQYSPEVGTGEEGVIPEHGKFNRGSIFANGP